MKRLVLSLCLCLVCLVLQAQETVHYADKKELDEQMTELIAAGSVRQIEPLDVRTLTLHQTDSIGILSTQGTIYMIDEISDDLYYSTWGDTLQILWDPKYAAQSLTNLLLGQIAKPDFGIDLTHRRYGLTHPRFHVSWASLFNTLRTEGVRIYASAITREGSDTIRGVLVVHQPNGNSLHMLIVTTTIAELFASEGELRDLKADLFTNIPQHNILNFYE